MIVSWDWLSQYVRLDFPVEELQTRLMMAGLNHEGTTRVGDDLAIDLEVTSNRPDCLGHLGVAREIAALWDRALEVPAANPAAKGTSAEELVRVEIACPQLCYRYTARVIRGVRIGASPPWLVRRLATVGIAAVNNVVDITNYVLMECAQPLHAFDFSRLAGGQIIVREAAPGERFEAINHKTYELAPGMCMIADGRRTVGIGGVMGGAETEVSSATRDVLIEAAHFDPTSIRDTSRRLGLHSDSSHRFERGVDPEGVDWASRRAAELILELAGGELSAGVVDIGRPPHERPPIVLRQSQLKRILGIEIDSDRVRKILASLGMREIRADESRVEVIAPSWRGDLSREIDLVEEVGRIHGYENIPEDVRVPMAASGRSANDRVLAKVRHVVTAAGYDEAITASLVDEAASEAFSPWTEREALRTQMPFLRGTDRLRRSLVPSLLAARRYNEALANDRIELFEIAKVYLPRPQGLPSEEWMLSLTSGGDYFAVKGVVESLVAVLDARREISVRDTDQALFGGRHACELWLGDERLGLAGEVDDEARQRFELRGATTVAEVRLSVLERVAVLVPKFAPLSPYPPTDRDINLVMDETVRWGAVVEIVRQAAGAMLDRLEYRETYRSDALGAGKKSLLFTVRLRGEAGTLTHEEADRVRDRIVAATADRLGAALRS